MEGLRPLTEEVLDALHAQVAVLDGDGRVIAVNSRWRRFGRLNGATSDFVGSNYLDTCATAARLEDRAAQRVHRGLHRLLDGQRDSFVMAYRCAQRIFRLRATRVSVTPMRVLVAHEDITSLLEARRRLYDAAIDLSEARQEHAIRIGAAYEELGQRLAAISLATHAIERSGYTSASVATIRIAVEEARHQLRELRYASQAEAETPAL